MKIALFAASIVIMTACKTEKNLEKNHRLKYPETRKDSVQDMYFGTVVRDPYRWLEDDNSDETRAWVVDQNEVTERYMSKIPFRDAIKLRLSELLDYERYSSPLTVGDYIFFYKNDGLQNQPVIYYQKKENSEPKVFIDPNALSDQGTEAIALLGASKDNRHMALAKSGAGSDWSEIQIRDIATNTLLDDKLEWVKFSGAAWYKDGFYYSRYPKPKTGKELSGDNKDHSIYYHSLGTPQASDQLFYTNEKNPNLYHGCSITEDESFMVMTAASGTDGFETFIKDMRNDGPLIKIQSGYSNKTTIIDYYDDYLYAYTNVDAPQYRLVKFKPEAWQQEHWVDVIEESAHTLVGVCKGGGYLFADYLLNAASAVKQYEYDGRLVREVALPALGSADGFSGKRDEYTLYYSFSSFTYPTTVFSFDVKSGQSSIYKKPETKFNPEDYLTEQKTFKSKDGTEIPLFIVRARNVQLDGTNPTVLYGYGGFNVSLSPYFSTSNICFLENGGVYAVANLRGGGEFGEDWHRAGMLERKQNVFDDFIGAAEFLISQRYTDKERLAIRGGSNGGLLVGAVMTQRPDLFAVALPAVGVLDMLRYQKFTVGKGWIPEYGSADSSNIEFSYLYAYSPLHNIRREGNYPATLITTGDHDDRVVPAHSFKFAATLQAAQAGLNPVLIRIETDAGHGAGKPINKIIEEQADIWAFTLYEMGVKEVKTLDGDQNK